MVASGGTLQIDPGVVVHIGAGYTVDVYGTIVATGTAGEPVHFTAPTNVAYGGAIRLYGTGALLGATGTFSHCTFSALDGDPGMLQSEYARLTIADCAFTDIPTTVIRPVDSRARITGCHIHDTHEGINFIRCAGAVTSNRIERLPGDWDAIDLDAYWTGGGDGSVTVAGNRLSDGYDDAIDVNFSPARITGNVVSNFADKAVSLGLGTNAPSDRLAGQTAIIDNNLIADCDMGIAVKDRSRPRIMNNTIVGCTVGITSYDKVDGPGYGSVTNTIVWNCNDSVDIRDGGAIAFGYCALDEETVRAGPGNTTAYPDFSDPDNRNYRLRIGSPCLDAGTNLTALSGAVDLDGRLRLSGTTMDMGAYESHPGALQCNATADARQGPSPLTVVFTAHAAGTNVAGLYYRWDAGVDGVIDAAGAGLGRFTNTFTTIGLHGIALTVSNAVGETDSVIRANYIRVLGPPDIYVATNGAHVYPYTNWVMAATNIAAAIAVAGDDSTITVSNGLYLLSSELVVDRPMPVTALDGPAATVLDGDGRTRCVRLTVSGARLAGFTLRNGHAAYGGGVALEDDAVVSNCTIVACHATQKGGGAYLDGAGLLAASHILSNTAAGGAGGVFLDHGGVLRDSVVEGNSAQNAGADGGGVMCYGDGLVDGCIVSGNTAADDGGGVQCGDNYGVPGGRVRNTRSDGNTCSDKGGGFMMWPDAIARNCVAVSNTANLGGGMMFRAGGDAAHVTIVANEAHSSGGATYSQGNAILLDSIIVSNRAPSDPNCRTRGSDTYTACCSTPLLAGISNTTAAARFADAPHDLHLTAASTACIDRAVGVVTDQDYAGIPRPLDGDGDGDAHPDIGAFEFVMTTADSDGDGMHDGWELRYGLPPTVADGTRDPDRDGMVNAGECIADTDPYDADSVLAIADLVSTTGKAARVAWPSRTTRVYRVLLAPHPTGTWASVFETNGSGAILHVDHAPTTARGFYRIGVREP